MGCAAARCLTKGEPEVSRLPVPVAYGAGVGGKPVRRNMWFPSCQGARRTLTRIAFIAVCCAVVAGCTSSEVVEPGQAPQTAPSSISSSSSSGAAIVKPSAGDSSSSTSSSSSSSGSVTGSAETIKVGSLHSMTGYLSHSERSLNKVLEMLVEQQNQRGGVLGKPLELITGDVQSAWPNARLMADYLIYLHEVDVIFSGSTSYIRKRALPAVEDAGGLMFYPANYEGQESSRAAMYTGAVPNQVALPVINHLVAQGVERWVVEGSDHARSRATSRIINGYLRALNVDPADVSTHHHNTVHENFNQRAQQIAAFAQAGKKTAILSTMDYTGFTDGRPPFYDALAEAGVSVGVARVVELLMTEGELARMDTRNMRGHQLASNYFRSVISYENTEFIGQWTAFNENYAAPISAPVAATYTAFTAWINAVEQAGSTAAEAVRRELYRTEVTALTGEQVRFLPNHHTTSPAYLAVIHGSSGVSAPRQIAYNIPGDSWTNFLPESAAVIADWQNPAINCGKYNVLTEECEQ